MKATLMIYVFSCAVLIWIAIAQNANAGSNALLEAVAFALLGSDDAKQISFDPISCIATTHAGGTQVEYKTNIYYLNQVDVDRVGVREVHNSYSKWVEVDLHGTSTIFQSKGTIISKESLDPQFKDFLTRNGKNVDAFLAEQSPSLLSGADTTLTIYTNETQRIMRAWRYIYTHGCTGKHSAF